MHGVLAWVRLHDPVYICVGSLNMGRVSHSPNSDLKTDYLRAEGGNHLPALDLNVLDEREEAKEPD